MIEELRQDIGKLAFETPRAGRRAEAIERILKYVEADQGEAMLLQWLVQYIGDAGLIRVGMRIVTQPEPAATTTEDGNPAQVEYKSYKG